MWILNRLLWQFSDILSAKEENNWSISYVHVLQMLASVENLFVKLIINSEMIINCSFVSMLWRTSIENTRNIF